MAGSDFHGYRRNVTDGPNVSLWVGEVTKAPTTVTGFATVRSLHGAGSEDIALGDAPWPQPRGKALPAVGDECLVALDNQNNPWIVAWLAPGYPGPPTLASVLPSSPYDGQEIYFQNAAMATAGVEWHLRYRAASASAYKWEYVGGGSVRVPGSIGAEVEIPKTEFFKPPGSPTLTIPLAGDYDVYVQATVVWRAKANTQLLIHPGETSGKQIAVDIDRPFTNVGGVAGTLSYAPISGLFRAPGLGKAGTICVAAEAILGAEATKLQFFGLAISAVPVRVG